MKYQGEAWGEYNGLRIKEEKIKFEIKGVKSSERWICEKSKILFTCLDALPGSKKS